MRVAVEGEDLVVRHNPVEALLCGRGRVRVPVAAIERVDVDPAPLDNALDDLIVYDREMVPRQWTGVYGRGRTYDRKRAHLYVAPGREALVVHLRPNPTSWRRLVVTVPEPRVVARTIRASVPVTPAANVATWLKLVRLVGCAMRRR